MKKWKTWLLRIAGLFLIVMIGGVSWGYWQVRSSLPTLEGRLELLGLSQKVTIERDNAGVPTIHSNNRFDTAFALGFLHGQERFFQMDLLRRVPAGRLAELFGQRAVDNDRLFRKHRFQPLAEASFAMLSANEQRLLTAYTQGVNSGLNQLSSVPLEYQIIRQKPQAWQPPDCMLAMLAMMCQLQDQEGERKLALGQLQEKVPAEIFAFLVRDGTVDDAAVDGTVLERPAIPPAEVWSLRQIGQKIENSAPNSTAPSAEEAEEIPGSNSFAVAGSMVADGRAILASDMHLGLRVPTTWYRVVMQTPVLSNSNDASVTTRRLVGVTLPGTPLLVAGSNGSVAWSFTNAYVDTGDIVELIPAKPAAKSDEYLLTEFQYLTEQDTSRLQVFKENIEFVDGSLEFEYFWSEFGPVVNQTDERLLAHRWIGHQADAFDLRLFQLENASSVEQALDIAAGCGMPHQNILIVDDQGHIGWTLTGRLPDRPNGSSSKLIRSDQARDHWNGYLSSNQYPCVYNPDEGRIWTANNRIVGGDDLQRIGNGSYAAGHRAKQIRDRLRETDQFVESDLLKIQLDDEGCYLIPWRDWFLEGIEFQPTGSDAKAIVENGDLRASVDSVAYTILQQFRMTAIEMLTSEIAKVSETPSLPGNQEDWVKQLLDQRPEHWLPIEFESWPDLLATAVKRTEETLIRRHGSLAEASWGRRNRVRVQHPMAAAIPWLGAKLNMPEVELPGDSHVPRVQGPAFGASQRMVVVPGREEDGIYHQPGGQSGHPLSPYYRTGFDDWATGRPSLLLPGQTRYRLELIPVL